MSVEGLSWEARIETDQLEKDAAKLESVLSNIGRKQVEEEKKILAGISKNYTEVYQDGLRAFQGLSPQVQKQISILQSFESELLQVGRAQRQLDADLRKGSITQSQYNKASAGLLVSTQQLNANIQKYSTAIRSNQAVMNAANGSIDQKRAKLAQLQTQLNSLSEAELRNARVGGQVRSQILSLEKDLSRLDRAYRTTGKGNAIFNQVLLATSGFLTITQGSRLVQDIARVRGEIEQLEVAFTTMLRSKSAADSLMKDILDVSLNTPFKLTEVADATKQLLAYGFAQKDIKSELLAIGNVASGVGSTFQEVAYAYGTLKTQGRAFARDIRQFTGRGIPIVAELAKQFDVSESKINEMVSAGKIGFPEVQKAFQAMTSEGGIFFNLMEKQSQTLTGEISKLQDKIQLLFNEIGKSNSGIFKAGIEGLGFLVDHYEDLVELVKILVITYGSYRAALVLVNAGQILLGTSTAGLTAAQVVLNAQTALSTKMNALWGASMAALPIVAITATLALLTTSVIAWGSAVDAATASADTLARIQEEGNVAAGRQSDRIKEMLTVIKSEVSTLRQKEAALKSLKDLIGPNIESYSLEEIAAGKATKAIEKYTEAQRKNAEQSAAYQTFETLNEQILQLEQKGPKALGFMDQFGQSLRNTLDFDGKSFGEAVKGVFYTSDKEASDRLLENLKTQREELKKSFDFTEEVIGNAEPKNLVGFDALILNVSHYFDTLVQIATDKSQLDQIKDGLQQHMESLAPNDPQISKIKSQLIKVNKLLETYNLNTETKGIKDTAAARKKVLDELANLEDKAYKRAFDKREQQIEDAKRQYADLRDAAKDAGLGKGVLDRIDRLEEKDTGNINYRTDTEELKEEFDKRKILYQQYEQYTRDFGIKAADEKYAAELDIAKNYLGKVQEEYSKLTAISPEDRSGVEIERLRVVQDILEKEKAEQSAAYNQLLLMAQNYNQKREVLESNYQKDRAKIVAGGDVKYLEQFDRSYKEAIAELNRDAFLDSSGFTKFFDNIEFMSRKAALDGVKVLKEELIRLSKLSLEDGGLNPEVVKQLNAQLDQTAHNVKMEIPQGLATIAGELSSIAGLIGDSNKGLSKMLNIMSSVIGNLGKMKAGVLDFKAAQAANDGQGDTLGMITSGLGIAGAAVGAVSAIVGIFKTASEKSVAMQKKQLDFQRQIFFGELAISELYRDRALASAEVAGSTLKSLIAQRQVLDQSLNSIDSDIDRITSKFGTGIEKGYLDIINQQRGLAGSQMEKLFEGLSGQLYKSGTRKVGGFLGIGKKEIDVYESLAGLSFDRIEKLSLEGKLTEQAESLFQQLVKLKEEGKAVEEQWKAIGDQLDDMFTGNLEWSGMADGIIEEFQGAGSQIEDILRNAILSGFKYRFLEEPLNKLIDQFAEDAQSGGELSMGEIDAFTQAYNKLTEDSKRALEQLEKSTGIELSNPSGSKAQATGIQGGIQRSITEETSAELAGLWRGTYDLIKIGNNVAFEHLSVANSQLTATLAIQTNTFNTVIELRSAVVELKTISKNTKPGQGGRDTGWGP